MRINTDFLLRCVRTLEDALHELEKHGKEDGPLRDICRAACVKEFELILEQSGKQLRKRLSIHFSNNRQADQLTFKDLFRHASKHGLLEPEVVERWLVYRDRRNESAHDYGESIAEAALDFLPVFASDARALAAAVEQMDDD